MQHYRSYADNLIVDRSDRRGIEYISSYRLAQLSRKFSSDTQSLLRISPWPHFVLDGLVNDALLKHVVAEVDSIIAQDSELLKDPLWVRFNDNNQVSMIVTTTTTF